MYGRQRVQLRRNMQISEEARHAFVFDDDPSLSHNCLWFATITQLTYPRLAVKWILEYMQMNETLENMNA